MVKRKSDSRFDAVFPDPGRVGEFRAAIVAWFEENGADYPWRRTRDPYAILVSELMLQQTRIATVLERGYYLRWMERFPDWGALAAAAEDELLAAWEGLGYYNRARNLQKAARVVRDEHGGRMPESPDEVLALPGVGRYTAGAVLSFAFGTRAPVVDGNVVRVLSRLLAFEEPVDSGAAMKRFWEWAEALTPAEKVGAYNSGIMELGQRVCTKSAPGCENCPVSGFCRARSAGSVDRIPVKAGKAAVTRRVERVGVFTRDGRILLAREQGSRRRGLWRLPELTEEQASDLEECFRFPYSITRYRVDLRVFAGTPGALDALGEGGDLPGGADWHPFAGGAGLPPLGSPYRRAIERYREEGGEKVAGD